MDSPFSKNPKLILIDTTTTGDTILLEILTRLSCKSCLRSKLVSKRWCSLISKPYFFHKFILHRQLSLANKDDDDDELHYTTIFRNLFPRFPEKMVKPTDDSDDESLRHRIVVSSDAPIFQSPGFSLGFLPVERPDLVASCHDLLLCSSSSDSQTVYYICNPLTLQWIELPLPPPRRNSTGLRVQLLTYPRDDNAGTDFYLFVGYRYRVLRIPELTAARTTFDVEIFSSETGEWSESVVSCPPGVPVRLKTPIRTATVYSDVLHWLLFERDGCLLFVYDPASNRFRIIKRPDDMSYENQSWIVSGSCSGRIRMCQLISRSSLSGQNEVKPFLKFWELNEVGSDSGQWKLLHNTYLRDMWTEDAELAEEIKLQRPDLYLNCIHPSNGDLLHLHFGDGSTDVLYNLQSNELSVLGQENYKTTKFKFRILEEPPMEDEIPLQVQWCRLRSQVCGGVEGWNHPDDT